MNEKKSLKTIPRDVYTSFVKYYLSNMCQQENKQISINTNEKTAVVFCNHDADEFVKKINKNVSKEFNKFIEKTLKDNCRNYSRNMILFTSSIDENDNNKIIFNWV